MGVSLCNASRRVGVVVDPRRRTKHRMISESDLRVTTDNVCRRRESSPSVADQSTSLSKMLHCQRVPVRSTQGERACTVGPYTA